jgi:hypothetical protein
MIKIVVFIDWLIYCCIYTTQRDGSCQKSYQILKEDSAPWSKHDYRTVVVSLVFVDFFGYTIDKDKRYYEFRTSFICSFILRGSHQILNKWSNRLTHTCQTCCFQVRSQNCEKRLLPSSCQFVHQSAWNNSAPAGRILIKFRISALFENLSRKFKFH